MYLVAYTALHDIPIPVVGCLVLVALRIILRLPEHHIHYVLPQTWILKQGPINTGHKPQFTMYGFVVPSSYIYWPAVYIVFILFCVAGIFWYEFLLEATIQHTCIPSEVDYFFAPNFWDLFKFVEPLDCNHVPSGVYTFICYKYKFDINDASWTAGRAFGISIFIIKALPACFLIPRGYNAQMYRILQYPIVLLCLIIILGRIILTVKNPTIVWEIYSISFGILLSLTVLFLDFKQIPASRHG